MPQEIDRPSSRVAALTSAFVIGLYAAWCGAWLVERALESHAWWMTTGGGRFAYWTAAKALLWILPAVILIRLTGRRARDVIALNRLRSAVSWGVGVGLILGVIALATKALSHHPLFSSDLSWGLMGGLVVAPIVEEMTFRGAVMGALAQRYPSAVANVFAALFFVGSHVPGWYFQGRLAAMLLAPIGGALSIFLLGLVFGFVMQRSQSVIAPTLAHILNNLFNA